MASKIARDFLAANGIVVKHTNLERSNFATGRGFGKLASPFHIVEVDTRNGTSKKTVGWARTIEQAREQAGSLARIERAKFDSRTGLRKDANHFTNQSGATFHESRKYYYIHDIRTNEIVT